MSPPPSSTSCLFFSKQSPSHLIFSKLVICPLESQGYGVHLPLLPQQRSVNKLLSCFSLGKLKEEQGGGVEKGGVPGGNQAPPAAGIFKQNG